MRSERQGLDWRLVVLVFVLLAGFYVARALFNAPTTPLINDTDDAMRLLEVRDFLAGQGWFDLAQHRLGTPFGVVMHWSRLIDLPIAALILVLRPFAGAASETVAAYVWPLIMLLGLLWLTGRLAIRLAGRDAALPALVLTAFSLISIAEFAPGRFDHHSAQILLTLAMVLASIAALERPRLALGTGLAAGAALAIGIESLPAVVAAAGALAILWVVEPQRAPALRWFGLGFASATVLFVAVALPPENWLLASCDAISVVYAAAALGVGLAFFLLSLLPLGGRPVWMRLAAAAVAAIVLAGLLALLFPGCARGPYGAVDPWVVQNWMNRVDEARPFWTELVNNPTYAVAVGLPAVLGLAVACFHVFRGAPERRNAWLVYGLFLLLIVAIMLLQVRASRMATTLATPAGAALVVSARALYLRRPRLLPILGLVGSWIGFAGFGVALVVFLVTEAIPHKPANASGAGEAALGSGGDCRLPAAYTALAALPPQRLMTPIDLGAHTLLFTAHEVVAGPYHRDGAGIRDSLEFFNLPIEQGRTILERRGVSLVAICMDLPEMRGLPSSAPDSFIRLERAGKLPDWLELASAPGATIQFYRVRPPA